jgi:hypothetical protein
MPIALGTGVTWASQAYRAVTITETDFNFQDCLYVTQTTWYGFPIPWSFTVHTLVFKGCQTIDFLYPYPDTDRVSEGAFLLDILIYAIAYYASILALVGVRTVVFTKNTLEFCG